MNDAASDTESTALTYEEALQVLRLSPEGLRRLADLDEAIAELNSARRSLLANRLESIRDAFDAARKSRAVEERNNEPGNGEHEEALPSENGVNSSHRTPHEDPSQITSSRVPVPSSSLAQSSVVAAERPQASEVLSVQRDLRTLRAELAELRREMTGYKRSGSNGSDAELQQVQRRLSYLEAEIESREI